VIYSIYRPELRKYDYYERPSTPDDARNPKSDSINGRHSRSGSDGEDLGVSSGRAGYTLPSGVRFIGRGDAPQGMVASKHPEMSGLGGAVDVVSKIPALGWLAIGLIGYQFFKKVK